MTYKTPPEGPPLKALEKRKQRKQPEGPPSGFNRKYNTKGSEYRPGMRLKPKGSDRFKRTDREVPAVEESLMNDDDLG